MEQLGRLVRNKGRHVWKGKDAKLPIGGVLVPVQLPGAACKPLADFVEEKRTTQLLQALPTPSSAEAQLSLPRLSARALGIATETDLRDYFRLGVADTKARTAELVEAGELLAADALSPSSL